MDAGISGVYTFYKGIRPKVNPLARLAFELVFYDTTGKYANHETTGAVLSFLLFDFLA